MATAALYCLPCWSSMFSIPTPRSRWSAEPGLLFYPDLHRQQLSLMRRRIRADIKLLNHRSLQFKNEAAVKNLYYLGNPLFPMKEIEIHKNICITTQIFTGTGRSTIKSGKTKVRTKQN